MLCRLTNQLLGNHAFGQCSSTHYLSFLQDLHEAPENTYPQQMHILTLVFQIFHAYIYGTAFWYGLRGLCRVYDPLMVAGCTSPTTHASIRNQTKQTQGFVPPRNPSCRLTTWNSTTSATTAGALSRLPWSFSHLRTRSR